MSVLTLDIGGSSIKSAWIEGNGEILMKTQIPTPKNTKEELMNAIASLLRKQDCIQGLAISMPGVIDSTQGYLYTAGALHYLSCCNFAGELNRMFHLPVWIGNDARCAASAELGYGCLQTIDDAIVILLGTGIGGCLIKDHQIHYGKHHRSGEVSSIHLDLMHPYDSSRNWWALNGISGLSTLAKRHFSQVEEMDGKTLFHFVDQEDERAIAVLKEFSEILALQLFNLQAIFDGEVIAIGGGISAQPRFIEEIQIAFEKIAQGEPIFIPKIQACTFYNDANLLGAYYGWRMQYQ